MLTRILFGILITTVLISVFLLGEAAVTCFALLLSLMALREFFNTVSLKSQIFRVIGFVWVLGYYLLLHFNSSIIQLFITALLLVYLSVMVFKYPAYSIKDVGVSLLGIAYVILFSYIPLLYNSDMYDFWILSIFLIACCSDSFAYFTGMLLGKRKLAPALSPKKTIEGSIGGIVGTGMASSIFIYVFSYKYPILLEQLVPITLIYMFLAGLSQIGDLAASAIKREFCVKDYGTFIPGHGGVLDRFDSVIFVAPIVYTLANLI